MKKKEKKKEEEKEVLQDGGMKRQKNTYIGYTVYKYTYFIICQSRTQNWQRMLKCNAYTAIYRAKQCLCLILKKYYKLQTQDLCLK